MKTVVNVALQVLPFCHENHPYEIVDKAILHIAASGIKYEVCPFETVMEGDYDKIMGLVKEVQVLCLENGADTLISNLKIEWIREENASIEKKMSKYR